jgi:hypothetical protein
MGVLASFLISQSSDENSQPHDKIRKGVAKRADENSQRFCEFPATDCENSQDSQLSQRSVTENTAPIKLTVKDKVYLIEIPTGECESALPSPAENENPVTPVANPANLVTLAVTPMQSTPAADARASVDRLLADMAEENERRRNWYVQPVAGWREGRLAWRSVMTGEETVIRLPKRRSWQ